MTDPADKITRTEPLHQMFTAVPPRYDLINHIITWGLDKRWRRKIAAECLALHPDKVLDLCCGTGDLAINLAQLARNGTEITGTDYSEPMLEIAVQKAALLPPDKKPSFIYANAANLPFPDDYFDCVGISFAFRNLTYKNSSAERYIAEVLRVLKPGGRFVIVETTQPGLKLIRALYHLYLRWFAYRVGSYLSGNRGAYRYLAESAARFYDSGEVKELLTASGFRRVYFKPLLFGVAGIHTAIK